ncbi:hypothetical protein SAMN04488128_102912 [Chitinophaga eiseniae]|uniref:Uncharacterized protein n=1 Tax=Chitinophaga eiseniae TaxID=634771 RepID=A0A1T4R7M3_9BACT|nr:hypothetical protein [Chitinophaga eiseniae]SKA11887.1 hypothetical protein SAMN04488128_102912 [Chitinophaga eiseniae]
MNSFPVPYLQETANWTQQTFDVSVPPGNISYAQLEEILGRRLEYLISTDLQQFIFLLYRIDVSEKKVRQILAYAARQGTDPYRPIAALIIERQLQKIASREAFRQDDLPDDEERW